MRNCNFCKWCVMQDTGYSNWTVEGTDFECRMKAHPEGDFDRWYGEDSRLNYAKKCEKFEAGKCIEMDVEKEGYDYLTDEQKRIFDGEV